MSSQRRLQRDVRKVFCKLLVMQETIKLTERQLDNTEERYRQAQENLKAGFVPELTAMLAQVVRENRQPAFGWCERVNYCQAFFSFENMLRREPDPDQALSGILDITTPEVFCKFRTLNCNIMPAS